MGENAEKGTGWWGNSSHCQNPTQTPPSLFILKNKDLNLKEEDQLNVQFGELGKNNGGHHWKSTQIHLPYLSKWIKASIFRGKSGQTIGEGADGNPRSLKEGQEHEWGPSPKTQIQSDCLKLRFN